MALKTLSWCPQPKYTVEEEPRRKALNFGDGYQADGGRTKSTASQI